MTALPLLLASLLAAAPATESAAPPRLVVMIVVDQLVPEQLQRLAGRFTGGFRRLLDEGAVFWRATIDYAGTETGPGHATFATGRWPMHSGIVGNMHYERAEGRLVYCVADPSVHPVTSLGLDATKEGSSPARLLGDGLCDLLERRDPAARTLTIAGKDRSAVLLGGHAPDAALWWHGGVGGFSSSSHYGERLPEFANVWNQAWRERARGWEWRAEEDTGELARLGTAPDERPGEVRRGGRTLPRALPTEDAPLAGAVLQTPLIDFFTLEIASLALDTEQLGRDDVPDFLGLSLSACDMLGHAHGPYSLEVTDLLLRNDRDLGRLFQALDDKVGKGRWIACLSSDHGVLDLPESLAEQGVGARRVAPAEVDELRASVEEALVAANPGAAPLSLRYADLGFAFDVAAATAAGLDPAELRSVIAAAAEETPWIAEAYTLEELLSSEPADAWLTFFRRSSHPQRVPDVVLRADPWLLLDLPEGTGHGSPYPYDRRVPLVFLGAAVKPQHRFDAASPTDAVPTLLSLLGLEPPADLDGRVLALD